MPVPIEKLRQASRPLADRILEFLSQHPESGYTVVEICSGVENFNDTTARVFVAVGLAGQLSQPMHKYGDALERLAAEGKVWSAEYAGVAHYAIKAPK